MTNPNIHRRIRNHITKVELWSFSIERKRRGRRIAVGEGVGFEPTSPKAPIRKILPDGSIQVTLPPHDGVEKLVQLPDGSIRDFVWCEPGNTVAKASYSSEGELADFDCPMLRGGCCEGQLHRRSTSCVLHPSPGRLGKQTRQRSVWTRLFKSLGFVALGVMGIGIALAFVAENHTSEAGIQLIQYSAVGLFVFSILHWLASMAHRR